MNKIVVGVLVLLMMASTTICYADGVIIPGSIKVKAFKKEMKKYGFNLDGEDDSDGYIENYGTKIKVITYKPVTLDDLEVIKKVAFENVRR